MPSGPRPVYQSTPRAVRPRPIEALRRRANSLLGDGGATLPAGPLLGLICGASMVTLVLLGTRLTFFNDDWYFLLQRPGFTADSLLTPHNGHLSVLPVLVYKGLVEVFGLGSQVPFRVVLALWVVALGIVMYVLVNERAGRLLGLAAAASVVFLGAASEDLLFFASITLIGALTTGLGALLALERDNRLRNVAACLLLVLAVSQSGLGISFVVAATIAVLLRCRPGQLWIPAVPTLLFAVWWLAYGRDAPSGLSADNLQGLPEYVFDCITSGLGAIAGQGGHSALEWGRLLLVVLALGIAIWVSRGGRPSARVLIFLSAALAFWFLSAASYIPGREAIASRYQLVHVALLILIVAELFRPVRLSATQGMAVVALALVAFGLNVKALRSGYHFMQGQSAYVKADIGALEITRGRSAPGFRLVPLIAHNPHLTGVTVGRYFDETRAHGAPRTYSPREIAAAPPPLRQAADHVIVGGYRIRLAQERPSWGRNACRRLPARSESATREVELPIGGGSITNLGKEPVVVGVRRFAPPNLPVPIGFLGAGLSSRVVAPRDSVTLHWHVTARGSSAVRVCAA
jgi:hypothetical protein